MHEKVIIVTKEKPTYELICNEMQPFEEFDGSGRCRERLKDYLIVENKTSEMEEQFHKSTTSFYTNDGEHYFSETNKIFKRKCVTETGYSFVQWDYTGYNEIKIHDSEIYRFDEYCKKFSCYKWDEYSGMPTHTDNPNGHWDYWTLIGRYSGCINSNNPIYIDEETEKRDLRCSYEKSYTEDMCNCSQVKDITNLNKITCYDLLMDGKWYPGYKDGKDVHKENIEIVRNLDKELYITILDIHL